MWDRTNYYLLPSEKHVLLNFMKILQLSFFKEKYCRRLKKAELAWEFGAHQFSVEWPLLTSSSFLPDIQTMKEFTQLGEQSPSQNQDLEEGRRALRRHLGVFKTVKPILIYF